jgi:hypothetical protein
MTDSQERLCRITEQLYKLKTIFPGRLKELLRNF